LRPGQGVDAKENLAALVSDFDLKVRDFRRIGVRDKYHGGHYGFGASRCGVWEVSAIVVLFDQAVSADVEMVAGQ
jgi:hypothetical protein